MRCKALIVSLLAQSVCGQQFYPLPGCESSICAFPPDAADFLVGTRFDFRIELHTDAFTANTTTPSDIRISITSIKNSATRRFKHDFSAHYYTTPLQESYSFTHATSAENFARIAQGLAEPATMHVDSLVWRNLVQHASGDYKITIDVPSRKLQHVMLWTVHAKKQQKARNVILFIADGASTSMITAARMIAKRDSMRSGKFNSKKLHMDTFFDYMGHIITNGLDSLITDSANSATSYSTGHKTSTGALGVYPDSSTSQIDNPRQEHIMEILRRERSGCALGIVTTAEINDATPAAFYAHTSNRDAKPILVEQLLNGSPGWNAQPVRADVILGGGGKYFAPGPKSATYNSMHYFDIYQNLGYQLVLNATSLQTIDTTQPLLGIFSLGNMNVWMDRHLLKENLVGKGQHPLGTSDALDQPDLIQMTLAALDVLQERGDDGFFLLVEAASVDKMNHQLDSNRALGDLLEMDKTLEATSKWLEERGLTDDTLMIFTSDHGHGFEVYGTVDTELFNKQRYESEHNLDKREAIGTYDQGGWPNYKDTNGDGWIDDWNPRFTLATTMGGAPAHYQTYQLPLNITPLMHLDATLTRERGQNVYVENRDKDGWLDGVKRDGNIGARENFGVHSMQDVPVFARGPGSRGVAGVFDNNELFFVMADALGLGTEGESDESFEVRLGKRDTQEIKNSFPDYPRYRHMHEEEF